MEEKKVYKIELSMLELTLIRSGLHMLFEMLSNMKNLPATPEVEKEIQNEIDAVDNLLTETLIKVKES